MILQTGIYALQTYAILSDKTADAGGKRQHHSHVRERGQTGVASLRHTSVSWRWTGPRIFVKDKPKAFG